jgi:HSP90 family molecular chaperone
MQAIKERAKLSLIGQFCIGFFSVFLATGRVAVVSKHNDDG